MSAGTVIAVVLGLALVVGLAASRGPRRFLFAALAALLRWLARVSLLPSKALAWLADRCEALAR